MGKEEVAYTSSISGPGTELQELAKEKLLGLSEVSLWLETYNDIFSSFDPRPYSQKALSEDFLEELNRASRDKPTGSIEISLLIAKIKRKPNEERIIKKRLKNHFDKHYSTTKREIFGKIRFGLAFILFGMITMFLAALILLKEGDKDLLFSFIIILLEPAGWFLFWEGLNQVIFEPRNIKPKLDFYKKMSSFTINFRGY